MRDSTRRLSAAHPERLSRPTMHSGRVPDFCSACYSAEASNSVHLLRLLVNPDWIPEALKTRLSNT